MDAPSEIPSPFYRVSLKALVFDGERRLLLAQEPDGFWELPGGGWEHGETLEACVRRELREELGGELRSLDVATLHPCTGPGRGYRRLKLVLRAELADGALAPGEEIEALRWVTRAEFPAMAMRDGDDTMRTHILSVWPA